MSQPIQTIPTPKKPVTVYGPALFCFTASFLALLALKLAPADSSDLAVIFPPGVSLEESFRRTAASGGYITGNGSFDNIIHFKTPAGPPPEGHHEQALCLRRPGGDQPLWRSRLFCPNLFKDVIESREQ